MSNSMVLQFVGEDKSMGLTKGSFYNVCLYVFHGYFCVSWNMLNDENKVVMCECPYSSLKSFAENWALPKPRNILQSLDFC